ncbi:MULTISPECIES: DUF1657 domain-containing protein [Clostridium]|jgi:hypothetical protein|uniref:DUF1657 domain-containing protein n=1 Tax=Clostridium saccharoperbutylacetonicum N1-4(HMT) TaxID=931276 RepID=M1MPD7_9CLOT|nr:MULTISPECIES: DUF1657 domain-containing protein [Clostridium]AGF58088.1 hypothetical protein DUF1657 [Clostridium saccharoperbutylacetonicum N1-4(HMT)]AQR96778.1 hypothetical protein CLSAP_41020 [Clostridium saccharoperbutylacetonicum]NRT61138.1 hypothetical protein [Clostridium saccharoperbutylacetonicum]NSB24453.1 hypothetical protein [Clostridium saccharoperbutylacetonicum]NSB32656.1 hypothetical protein [Clostridium saccharoperbutylacetonicum]
MTVGTQMQKAIAGIQSAAATMKTFSLETEDQQAKQDFKMIAEQLDCSLELLKGRQKYIEEQEPQYKS